MKKCILIAFASGLIHSVSVQASFDVKEENIPSLTRGPLDSERYGNLKRGNLPQHIRDRRANRKRFESRYTLL